jgi:hypothetical protein
VANRYGSPKERLSSDPAFSQTSNAAYPQSYDPTDYNQPGYPQQPAYQQTAYTQQQQPTYDATRNMRQNYDQGYAAREGLTPSTPATKQKRNLFAFMSSKWAALFMAVTAIQAVVCLCFEA